jgi:hypothetical protein
MCTVQFLIRKWKYHIMGWERFFQEKFRQPVIIFCQACLFIELFFSLQDAYTKIPVVICSPV